MIYLLWASGLAFFLAWNLGANDVANAMGTSVGSKALSLRQALIIAGVLEFTGAVVFGKQVVTTLARGVVDTQAFTDEPQLLSLGMITVLITCGLWLQLATWQGWPVATSHATVGALAGFSLAALGTSAMQWSTLGLISLSWVLTPVISGAIAALVYRLIQQSILHSADPLRQFQEWVPWLSTGLISIFGVIVLPQLIHPVCVFLQRTGHWHFPEQDLAIAVGGGAVLTLTVWGWHRLDNLASPQDLAHPQVAVEHQLALFQVCSACFVAFAHGSNDVGNAIAPLVVIVAIHATQTIPAAGAAIPLWIMVLGGVGIVSGLAVAGKRVMTTVGENIIPLQPSSGFCAELAAATTILLASHWGFPVSTTHALVGGVVGIGLSQSGSALQFGTLRQIMAAWGLTLPICISLGALIFSGLRIFAG
ncbi:inorganic phosphate transporter [Acaryochloris sp. IP29b_bin.137]|uniref:inorganic phosphate transporter n=1 Tax=Acaryochloris sp. IP29b_bin.137 TaxID=2969217 RepID=UPI00344CC5E9